METNYPNKIDFLGKKYVEVTVKVVIEYDANELDIKEVVNDTAIAFYKDDGYGNETFVPKTDLMTVKEYVNTTFIDVTEKHI